MEQTIAKRWLVGVMLAVLLLATGPTASTALAQSDEVDDGGITMLDGSVCFFDPVFLCIGPPDMGPKPDEVVDDED
jgi:hypothetical protein